MTDVHQGILAHTLARESCHKNYPNCLLRIDANSKKILSFPVKTIFTLCTRQKGPHGEFSPLLKILYDNVDRSYLFESATFQIFNSANGCLLPLEQ